MGIHASGLIILRNFKWDVGDPHRDCQITDNDSYRNADRRNPRGVLSLRDRDLIVSSQRDHHRAYQINQGCERRAGREVCEG